MVHAALDLCQKKGQISTRPFWFSGLGHTHTEYHRLKDTQIGENWKMKRSFNRLANLLSLHCRWAKQHQFLHNAMELPGIPDAKEPDGPEDGIVEEKNQHVEP